MSDHVWPWQGLLPGFGLHSSPSTACPADDPAPSDCGAVFKMYHDLEKAVSCEEDWTLDGGVSTGNLGGIANISYDAEAGKHISKEYAAWYMQAGGWDSPNAAVQGQETCAELSSMHDYMNGLASSSTSRLVGLAQKRGARSTTRSRCCHPWA